VLGEIRENSFFTAKAQRSQRDAEEDEGLRGFGKDRFNAEGAESAGEILKVGPAFKK
jgi:hypothetical protein